MKNQQIEQIENLKLDIQGMRECLQGIEAEIENLKGGNEFDRLAHLYSLKAKTHRLLNDTIGELNISKAMKRSRDQEHKTGIKPDKIASSISGNGSVAFRNTRFNIQSGTPIQDELPLPKDVYNNLPLDFYEWNSEKQKKWTRKIFKDNIKLKKQL